VSQLIDAAGYAGAAIGTVAIIPQVTRAYRVGVAGVSATTYQIALASGLMWIGYGFALGVWPQVPGNVVGGICCALILYQCWRSGQSLLSVVRVAVATLAAALVVALIGGVSSFSWAGTIFSNLCWFIYGAGHRDPRILSAAGLSMTLSVVIVQIVAVRRRRQAVAVAA